MIGRPQLFLCASAIVLSMSLGHTARAAVITYDLSVEFSGATAPAGATPWLRATFDDGGSSGSVTLTLTALNLTGSEFVSEWNFNLDPSLNPANLIFSSPTKTGTFANPTILTGVNAFQADGDGLYDIQVAFDNAPPANRFTAGESVVYTISGISSLTANSFNFLSAPAGGKGPFPTAAHVQGIGAQANNSGWVTVPEPAGAAILLIAAASVCLPRRRLS
ncbi:hypothetical protein [Fontivita pretiosa]|uniref:hypothetical protein n=1 Tax=Fontivita pretiosa TaxID=2989684 RepID=UPI003D175FB2